MISNSLKLACKESMTDKFVSYFLNKWENEESPINIFPVTYFYDKNDESVFPNIQNYPIVSHSQSKIGTAS